MRTNGALVERIIDARAPSPANPHAWETPILSIAIWLAKRLNLVPVPLLDVQIQMGCARAIIDANEIGVFAALASEPRGLTIADLAQAVTISPTAAAVLLDVLLASGYVRRRGDHYTNGPWVKKWITDPATGIPHVLMLQGHAWGRLSDLAATLRTGRPAIDYHQSLVAEPSEKQAAYTRAMEEISRWILPKFLKRIAIPSQAKRLLDLGGAHGNYGLAVARRFPGLRPTVLDLGGPIATAREMRLRRGSADDIDFVVGDILQDDLGDDWDVILYNNMIHLFTSQQNREILSRVYDALRPDGVLAIQDQFLGIGRFQDRLAAFTSLNYFTVGGRSYRIKETHELLRNTGFLRIKTKPYPASPTALILAWK